MAVRLRRMAEKGEFRFVLDASAQMAYLEGRSIKLREIIEQNRVLTHGYGLGEVVSAIRRAGGDPDDIWAFMETQHQVAKIHPRDQALAEMGDPNTSLPEGLTLAVAADHCATAVVYSKGRVRLVSHERALRLVPELPR
ncbi:MAG: hypothetical protein AAFQ31_05595 [Planctomycetota bacterium]